MRGGPDGTLNFAALVKKKVSVSGTLLCDRSPEQMTAIMAEVKRLVVSLLDSAAIRSVTERVFTLSDAAAAHAHFETKGHVGKILLDCRQTD